MQRVTARLLLIEYGVNIMQQQNNRPDLEGSTIDPKNIRIAHASACILTFAKPSAPKNQYEQRPRDNSRQCSNPLIKQLHDAVKAGDINESLTAHSVEQWITKYNIRKGDGTRYKEGYAVNLLSNSLIKNKTTKNRNSKWLNRRINSAGVYEYWFAK